MFKKDSHINLMVFSVLGFALILEMFFILPSILTVLLGYLAVFAFVVLHYDTYTTYRHQHPFKTAFIKYAHLNLFERYGLAFLQGVIYRFKHFFHQESRVFNFQLLIQPTFLYWSAASLILLFVNPLFVQAVIIVSTVLFMILLASISSIYKKELVIGAHHLHLLSITKILIVFLAFMASYGYYYLQFIGLYNVLALTMAITFVLLYNYAWKTGELFKKSLGFAMVCWAGLFTALVCFLIAKYNINYYVAIISLYASYYFSFGIIKHYLKGDLTKKIFWEYLIASILLIIFIWSNSFYGSYIL
jgi:hypothetical protein